MIKHCGLSIRARSGIALGVGAVALALVAGASASSGTVVITGGGITINDDAPASPYPSTATVSTPGATVSDASLELVGFQHTALADVDIKLVSPEGYSVQVTQAQGWSGAVCGNYQFADGPDPIPDDLTGVTPGLCNGADGWAPGLYGPFGSFADLVDAIATGTWSLYVDDTAGIDVGSIRSWILRLFVLMPDRAGYCAAEGNTDPYTGAPIRAGRFMDLELEQVLSDESYAGATPANYVDGVGITCGPIPQGFVQQGFAPESLGVPANTYPFYKKG